MTKKIKNKYDMETIKQKGFVCCFHKQHTKDIITVFIRDLQKYALLKKDNEGIWSLVKLKYRKYFRKKEIVEITVFNHPPRYVFGYFIFPGRPRLSRKVFSLFKQIAYIQTSQTEGFGQIKKEYLIEIPT